jgi:hypothetical protein
MARGWSARLVNFALDRPGHFDDFVRAERHKARELMYEIDEMS